MCNNDCCHCCCSCSCDEITEPSSFFKRYGKCQEDPKGFKCKILCALKAGTQHSYFAPSSIHRNMNCTYEGAQRWHIYIKHITGKQIRLIEEATGMGMENIQRMGEDELQVTFDDHYTSC